MTPPDSPFLDYCRNTGDLTKRQCGCAPIVFALVVLAVCAVIYWVTK